MPTDSAKLEEVKRALHSLISTLQDSQKGFSDIGEHLKDEKLKRFFLSESLKRANFRAELEQELHRQGEHDVKESGTAAGLVHRVWGDLKARLISGDHSLLETAEQGEDVAKAAYKDALEQELPLPVHQLVVEQQAHILSSHDYIKSARDQSKS